MLSVVGPLILFGLASTLVVLGWLALRRRWGSAIGLAAALVLVAGSGFVWLLSGMSEYPSYDIGHPDRPHLTNTSSSTWYTVRGLPPDEVAVDRLRAVEPGQRMIFTSSTWQPRNGDVCLDHDTALVRPNASSSGDATIAVDDLEVVPLPMCFTRGEHELRWDGAELTHDPGWSPPLVHPHDRPLAWGIGLATAALLLGLTIDHRRTTDSELGRRSRSGSAGR